MSRDPDDTRSGALPPSGAERPPHAIYNWLSGFGAALASMSLAVIVFLLAVDLFAEDGSSYAGLTLLPPLLLAVVGLVLFFAGWLTEARRRRRGERSSFYDTWVLEPWSAVRRIGPFMVLVIVAGTTLVMLSAGASLLAVVEHSESNAFCTEACHSVMNPEGMAHAYTAHSRIDCVECHVAPGAEGYLEAKLGGLRQLYALATDQVSRPIPTPIHGNAISRELCERCHAPERNVGYKALTRTYYLTGEEPYPVHLAMAVKVGGEHGPMQGAGIHYHMQIAEKVEYIARDRQRQDIAWVRVTDAEGAVREYQHDSRPLGAEERERYEIRTMNCLDCHSRPAHRFPSPAESVNEALATGALSRELPSAKVAAVQALDGDYESTPEAMEGIAETLREFYEDEYPDFAAEQPEAIEAASDSLREIYARTIFPEMKADWRAHPDNRGHLDDPGCFRCHNDEMVDAEGESVFLSCNSCHALLAQDDAGIASMAEFDLGREFVHPEDWDTLEDFTYCSDCHTGGQELYE